MNYNKKTKNQQFLQDKYTPEFLEFIDDTYKYLKKYSGNQLAQSIGTTRSHLQYRQLKKKGEHESK